MEKRVVCPVAIDGSSETFLLVRSQEPSVVGVVAPSDLGIEFCPAICYFAVRCHLNDQFDC